MDKRTQAKTDDGDLTTQGSSSMYFARHTKSLVTQVSDYSLKFAEFGDARVSGLNAEGSRIRGLRS